MSTIGGQSLDVRTTPVSAPETQTIHLICLLCFPGWKPGVEFSAVCRHPFPAGAKVIESTAGVDCSDCLALVACIDCRREDAKHRCGGSA